MLHRAGGIGQGRSQRASAPDSLHFPINPVPIASIGQLLPSATPTRGGATTGFAVSVGRRSRGAILGRRGSAAVLPFQQPEDLGRVRQTPSNLVKPQVRVPSALCAGFKTQPRHYKSPQSHTVAPDDTRSHPSSLCPLSFNLLSNPVKPFSKLDHEYEPQNYEIS
jgi:hypothetical protein